MYMCIVHGLMIQKKPSIGYAYLSPLEVWIPLR